MPMKIQPVIDIDCQNPSVRNEPAKPVLKSRLKRLFDRQFRVSSAEKPNVAASGEAVSEFEPSSVCLAKMVQNYIEDEKPFRNGRHRCNCFNGNNNDSSDDEFDVFGNGFGTESIGSAPSFSDASDILKSLIQCSSVAERNLLADTSMIVEKNKNHKNKVDLIKIIADGLASIGYNSSICKSKWEKSASYPSGEYEYVDVITEDGERILIDIDFRSEFEIARSTGAYKVILQFLPYIFVGKSDRLGQIVSIVSEAAKLSLKKKGMPFPPWRRAEYMRAKWLSSFTRLNDTVSKQEKNDEKCSEDDCAGELELIFGEKTSPSEDNGSVSGGEIMDTVEEKMEGEKVTWRPPALKPKSVDRGVKMVTGLASLLKEKP